MKGFAKVIGQLPFAGKMTIRPLIFALYQSMAAAERARSYLFVMVLLVFFVLFHGVQVQMGIKAMSFDAPHWVKAISVLYAVANICVCLTQVYLGFRATRFYLCAPYPRVRRKDNNGFSDTHALIMLVVTVGGQIIFCTLYVYYG